MADTPTTQTPQTGPIAVPPETQNVANVTDTIVPVPTTTSRLPDQLALPTASPTNTIRNVIQTAQEREIVKTAPDIVVYFDGLPYLINHYLNDPDSSNQFLIVNFNDHVQNFNATYDVDNLVPSGAVHLSVPNHEKKLYQMPGGNNLIIPMMEVQVFAKGYFLSPNGNTIYHRVFKGVATQVLHTDNGKTLEISVSLRGVLRFMEMMQIDVQPSLQSNSNQHVVATTSIQFNLDPYQQIADTFLRSLALDQFQLNTINGKGQTVAGSEWEGAVKANYIAKWQSILNGVVADTHVMGYLFGSVPKAFDQAAKDSPYKGKRDPVYQAAAIAKSSPLAESDPLRDKYVDMIRGYTPDFGVGSITLAGGRIVPRLERIRTILHHIGFEGFQDINGEIIFKAPLYNLDVTNLAKAPASDDPLQASPMDKVTDHNNPFVVFLSEISNESETEDESMVRCTRLSAQGVWSTGFQQSIDPVYRAVVSHIDIPKLANFGLREEPARTVAWIMSADKFLLYTYAVNELVRENRGWRTYSFQIPLRPELRLGFPMYIPHKDMFGYLKTVSINYNIGGEAVMNVLLDSIRKRPMFPTTRTAPGTNDPQTILVAQKNLVMKWTKSEAETHATDIGKTSKSPFLGIGSTSNTPFTARPSASGDTPSNSPEVNLVGNSATLARPQNEPKPSDEQIQFANYRKLTMGIDWQTRSDTQTHNFRVQNDTFSNGPDKPTTGKPFFSREKWLTPRTVQAAGPVAVGGSSPTVTTSGTGIDGEYFQAIVNMQPYTDENGYEVVGVFPLGRWKSLAEAYKETREGKLVDSVNPQDQATFKKQDALIFAGLGTPSYDAAGTLLDKFKTLTEEINTNTSFELIYSTDKNAPPAFGPQSVETNLLKLDQPDNQPQTISDLALLTTSVEDVQRRIDLFISGTPQPSTSTKQELKITQDDSNSPTDFFTVISDFKSIGKNG